MNEQLLRYAVAHGFLEQAQADALWQEHARSGKSVRELLLEDGVFSEEQMLEALSDVARIPSVRLYETAIPAVVRELVKPDILRAHLIFPFAFDPEDDGLLCVALSDPANMKGRDMVAIASGYRVRPFLTTAEDILLAIDRCYGPEEVEGTTALYAPQERSAAEQALQSEINASPVVVLVNSLVEQAVRQRASDIHVEPGPSRVRVRYRVDGLLYTTAEYDLRLLPAIVARIKVMSGLDISEKRRPQDGHFSTFAGRWEYDVRVSVLPVTGGEKCVLRLARKKALYRSRQALGFLPEEMRKFDRILLRPNGLVLVTGPTGSGKSTTLYTALSELNRDTVNIVTVEDPVEAGLDGVNQVQVNPKANLTFANALRSILRQDPDIIMVGEIRDGETASIAVQASITGHLVVSTLHTNDTASSVTRLLDMGVERYLIADALAGIVAQRLVRRLCPNCRRRCALPPEAAALFALEPGETAQVYEPVGCKKCNGTGYYERVGVYEVMEITPRLRALIAAGCTADALREAATEAGMRTLQQNARRLVLDGVTSLTEIKRISIPGTEEQRTGLPGTEMGGAQ